MIAIIKGKKENTSFEIFPSIDTKRKFNCVLVYLNLMVAIGYWYWDMCTEIAQISLFKKRKGIYNFVGVMIGIHNYTI